MTDRTLVLNASYEPIQFVDWRRALALVFRDKAEVVASYDNKPIRSISTSIKTPKVVRLKTYIKLISNFVHRAYSKQAVHRRDGYICQYCGIQLTSKKATIDHIMPQSRGGRDTWKNTTTSCQKCNNKKDNMTPIEAGMKLLSVPDKPDLVKQLDVDLATQLKELIFDS
jgi:5-methylcytosine-specific restriction endonuclease McrA